MSQQNHFVFTLAIEFKKFTSSCRDVDGKNVSTLMCIQL